MKSNSYKLQVPLACGHQGFRPFPGHGENQKGILRFERPTAHNGMPHVRRIEYYIASIRKPRPQIVSLDGLDRTVQPVEALEGHASGQRDEHIL